MKEHDIFINISYFSSVKIANQYILNAMREVAPKYAKGNLIDLGCGTKPYESIFKPFFKSYYGVDYPKAMEKHYSDSTKADLYADCTDTKLKSESFDTVLSTEVMEHIFDTKSYVSECYRLLKKGGVGIFTVPFVWQSHAEPYDYYRFTKFSLEKIFKQIGFDIVELRPLQGAYATIIQKKIVTLYCRETNNLFFKIFRKIRNLILIPILNWKALYLDKLFWNDKLCLNYLVIVKK